MNKLDKYIGRAVRLKESIFTQMFGPQDDLHGHDNLFLVASVSHAMRQLVCYGANRRVTVGTMDVVLV